jgi:hypothetical protein
MTLMPEDVYDKPVCFSLGSSSSGPTFPLGQGPSCASMDSASAILTTETASLIRIDVKPACGGVAQGSESESICNRATVRYADHTS